jgi:hypothetical protein
MVYPRYECFGDSVSKGIFKVLGPMLANATLATVWEPFHPSSNEGGGCGNTMRGKDCTPLWLDGANRSTHDPIRRWDVISFNYGLHDLARDGEYLTVAEYAANLLNITTRLVNAPGRQPGTKPKIYWMPSTPVPDVPLSPPRNQSDVPLYNAAAATVMEQFPQIEVIDLYAFVVKACGGNPHYTACPGFQLRGNVHFEAAGWQALADFVFHRLTAGGL